jgi:hypothetical protein
MAKKLYVISLEVVMDDDENKTNFGNLNLGALDKEQKAGGIDSWDFRDIESCHNVKADGTVDFGEPT